MNTFSEPLLSLRSLARPFNNRTATDADNRPYPPETGGRYVITVTCGRKTERRIEYLAAANLLITDLSKFPIAVGSGLSIDRRGLKEPAVLPVRCLPQGLGPPRRHV